MPDSFSKRVYQFLEAYPHAHRTELTRVLASKTSLSTSGFPYISQSSFQLFLQEVPHLFAYGKDLLDWLANLEEGLKHSHPFQKSENISLQKAIFVLRNVVQSAGICAPPDHWILKHILSVHSKLGMVQLFLDGGFIDRDELADKLGVDRKHLSWDLSFLHSRGYLRCRGSRYSLAQCFQAVDIFQKAESLQEKFLTDMVDPIVKVIQGNSSSTEENLVREFYNYPETEHIHKSWQADHFQVGIGYRLVPTVLSLRVLNIASTAEPGVKLSGFFPEMTRLLEDAGVLQDDSVTAFGARILNRGPGPFGIIHAYVPYMRELENKLRGKATSTHVQRTKNIAASQAANRKTFEMGNDSLDRFCNEQSFDYRVFIEHALGQGEATRQRLERTGEENMQYFGADLEDAAIDAALELQKQKVLPANMIFVRRADIANPDAVITAVRDKGFSTVDAVMFVGNGFHEIRGQTNAKIIDVFRKYCEAGFLLIFTEESALGDHDLLSTGWNTYHAGFRYVHELSGQGLRPAAGADREGRYSWKICASLGGYAVLPKYSAHTRTIYPFPRKGGYNPPISMTYFCVPESLARKLGFYPLSWTRS
ncbi:hypothetical protein L0156_12830 [bacterium]|nr:hypothetical protein [bacterium]